MSEVTVWALFTCLFLTIQHIILIFEIVSLRDKINDMNLELKEIKETEKL